MCTEEAQVEKTVYCLNTLQCLRLPVLFSLEKVILCFTSYSHQRDARSMNQLERKWKNFLINFATFNKKQKFNKAKCWVLRFGDNNSMQCYMHRGQWLESWPEEKDLGMLEYELALCPTGQEGQQHPSLHQQYCGQQDLRSHCPVDVATHWICGASHCKTQRCCRVPKKDNESCWKV